jgi:hypothetical protein
MSVVPLGFPNWRRNAAIQRVVRSRMHADDLAAARQILVYCPLRLGHFGPLLSFEREQSIPRVTKNVRQTGARLSAFTLITLAVREPGRRARVIL